VTEIVNVQENYDRCADRVKRGHPLPSAVNHSLGALEALLTFLMDRLSRHLQVMFPPRPGFRDSYNFNFKTRGGNLTCLMSYKYGITETDLFLKDPLQWCMIQLVGDPDGENGYDHGLLFGFLDQYLASSSEK
jgi:hypothetical protein